jgi:hypothetical protein
VIFDAAQHSATVDGWYKARELKPPPDGFRSELGFVAQHAAAWLYLTGTALAMVEMLIVDPSATDAEREESLDAVFAEMMAVAAASGARMLAGYTRGDGVARRAAQHGWTVDPRPHQFVSVRLDEE